MGKKRKNEDRQLEIQWTFIVIAALLATFAGVAVNALYEFLRTWMSAFYILVLFGLMALSFVDMLTYMFAHISDLRKDENDSFFNFEKKYLKNRFSKLIIWKK